MRARRTATDVYIHEASSCTLLQNLNVCGQLKLKDDLQLVENFCVSRRRHTDVREDIGLGQCHTAMDQPGEETNDGELAI
jgi:hypothetical protein